MQREREREREREDGGGGGGEGVGGGWGAAINNWYYFSSTLELLDSYIICETLTAVGSAKTVAFSSIIPYRQIRYNLVCYVLQRRWPSQMRSKTSSKVLVTSMRNWHRSLDLGKSDWNRKHSQVQHQWSATEHNMLITNAIFRLPSAIRL